jgi:YegS/Rv2252/BmrU family lipid kinase
MTTCVVIRNPVARRGIKPRDFEAALGVLRASAWDVTVAMTEREGHATEIAREAAAHGVDVIVASGGDGTINEAINGIAGTDTALAVLPGGTANVWAHEMRIPRKPAKAMRVAIEGQRRRVDLGRANGRYFLLMAGVGFDASIIPTVSGRLKRRIGALSYILAGIRTIFRAHAWPARVEIDGAASDTSVYWMLVSNTRSYGGISDIMYRAVADDALFDVGIMHRGGPWRMIIAGILVLLRRHERSSNIDYLKARAINVETAGIPVQLDGELWGATPMRFEIAPLALSVIVPKGLRSPLFGAVRAVTSESG